MKIFVDGFLYSWINTGGIIRYFEELIRHLPESDTVSVLAHEPHHSIPLSNIVTPFPFPSEKLPFPYQLKRKLLKPFNKRSFEKYFEKITDGVFHSTYYTTYKNISIPQVVTLHDMTYEKFPDFFSGSGSQRFIEQKERAVSAATHVICVSENTKRDALAYYDDLDPNNVSVVYLGISSGFKYIPPTEARELTASLNIPSSYVLFVGERDRYKNFSLLLQALPHISSSLVVIGNPFTSQEVQEIRKYEVQNQIVNLGRVSDVELARLYAGSSCFVYPSLYEGFGMPLLEAYSCGAPVVAADIPVFRELASDWAFFFDPYDPKDLARAIEKASTAPHQENSIREKFNWKSTAQKTRAVYDRAANDFKKRHA